MTRKKSEDAVSPVIGVMLMLVVVIIIAAVVTVFATGTVAETEVAQIAKLDVKIISDQPIGGQESIQKREAEYHHNGYVPTMHLTHVSGDSLNTENLKLSFSWDCNNPTCSVKHHTSTYQPGEGEKIGPGTVSLFGDKAFPPTGYGETAEPLYINHGDSGGGFFGNHVLKRGEVMIAFDKHLLVPTEGAKQAGNPAMDVLFNNGKVITEYDETKTTTEKVFVGGTPGATYFVTNGEIHSPDSTCSFATGSQKDAVFGQYVANGFGCGACADWSTMTFKAHAPCPYCGERDTSIAPLVKICPTCEKDVSSVQVPTISEVTTTTIGAGYSAGIMACLTEGTAVKVIITHTPSNKVIYEDRVFVE